MLNRGKRFGFKQKKYSNPFFRKKPYLSNRFQSKVFRYRQLISFGLIIIALGLIWFFFFSPVFIINAITVSGAERISSEDIENLAWEQAKKRRFVVGSQININLYDKEELANVLEAKYGLESLDINKKQTHEIIINLREKAYAIIWKEGEKYYYLAADGDITMEADSAEIAAKEYPLIENLAKSKISDGKVAADKKIFDGSKIIYEKFKNKYPELAMDKFIIDDEINILKLALAGGPTIHFDYNENIDDQLLRLFTLIDETLKMDLNSKTYIKLEFGEKIFYK